MGKRIKLSRDQEQAFRALWMAVPRVPRARIAKAIGVHRAAISALAARLQLPERKRGSHLSRGTLLDQPGAEELFERLWRAGVANREILVALGKNNHPANVSQAARVRGLPKRPRSFRGMTLAEYGLQGMAESAIIEQRALRAAKMVDGFQNKALGQAA